MTLAEFVAAAVDVPVVKLAFFVTLQVVAHVFKRAFEIRESFPEFFYKDVMQFASRL